MVLVRARLLFRFFFVFLLLIGAISTYMILQTNHLVSQKSKSFKDQPIVLDQQQVDEGVPRTQIASAIPPTTKPDTRRRSLVIFGDDRSGTTLLTQMFSKDLDIFTVYEPLWITRKWGETEPNRNLLKDVEEVLGALMTCNFVDNPTAIKFLSHTSRKWAPGLFANPFQSKPICNDPEACPNPETIPDVVQKACLYNYKHSVIKVAIVRVPERKLSNIFQRIIEDNPDTVIKFLHVVRDPRGSINSRINLGWIPDVDKAKNFAGLPRSTCEGILQNVKFGASLQGDFKDRYMLLQYKDIASSPLVTAIKIYKFAGFEISESMIRWLMQATNPGKETLEQEGKRAFSSFRNSAANVQRWRHESPDRRVRIIEEECSELMDLLHLEKLP